MKVSKVAATTARRIFRLCSQNGRMNEEHLRMAIAKLGTEKPRDYRAMLQVLRRLISAELASKQVTVESATALDAATGDQLANSLRSQYGQDLTFTFKTTPELLGGLRIRVGNDVFDGSVKSRLDRLTNAF
ncbi:F0F1 ATP synthase subunit delta [bacterium]|nr:F0F1 ATP synthase subunit delta [bacterium]MDB4294646.1 F0F1 ATP synthase subunit delta [Akkermansiaceae bacterium]MDB4578146.1 F0F1 ATP synthase subunit delta [Akkermansiaceae bacterium]